MWMNDMYTIHSIFLITIIFFALEIQIKAYFKLYFWSMWSEQSLAHAVNLFKYFILNFFLLTFSY